MPWLPDERTHKTHADRAVIILKQQDLWTKAAKNQEKKYSDNLEAQIKTAYFLVEHNLPLSLFADAIELQKSNEAPKLQTSTYNSHEAVTDMLKAISDDISKNMQIMIEKSPFIGLMTRWIYWYSCV